MKQNFSIVSERKLTMMSSIQLYLLRRQTPQHAHKDEKYLNSDDSTNVNYGKYHIVAHQCFEARRRDIFMRAILRDIIIIKD